LCPELCPFVVNVSWVQHVMPKKVVDLYFCWKGLLV